MNNMAVVGSVPSHTQHTFLMEHMRDTGSKQAKKKKRPRVLFISRNHPSFLPSHILSASSSGTGFAFNSFLFGLLFSSLFYVVPWLSCFMLPFLGFLFFRYGALLPSTTYRVCFFCVYHPPRVGTFSGIPPTSGGGGNITNKKHETNAISLSRVTYSRGIR